MHIVVIFFFSGDGVFARALPSPPPTRRPHSSLASLPYSIMRVLNIRGRERGRERAATEKAAEASTHTLSHSQSHSNTHSLITAQLACSLSLPLSFSEAKMSCNNDREESDCANVSQNLLTPALPHTHMRWHEHAKGKIG